jgi:amidase
VGPITRSAEDLALVLDVLAGPAAADAVAWQVALPAPKPRDRIRVGLWLDDPFCPLDREYHTLLTRLADRLTQTGIEVVDARPDVSFHESFEAYWTLLAAANGLNEPSPLTHAEWLQVSERRLAQRHAWSRWFDQFDALLAPVLAVSSYPHDHTGTFATRTVSVDGEPRTHVDIARWTGLIGALGLPVAVAPAGHTSTGKPVGVQIIAARWHDRTAVEIAAAVAETAGGYRPPPGFDVP